MSLVVTPGYTWVNGEVETATKLNLAATPIIADGQAGVFSTASISGVLTSTASGQLFVRIGATTTQQYFQLANNGGNNYFGIDDSAGTSLSSGLAYSAVVYGVTGATLVVAATPIAQATLTGLAVTGALSATSFINGYGTVRVASPFTKSASATLADVTGLSVNLISGQTYEFRVVLFLTNTAGGYKVALTGTSTFSDSFWAGGWFLTAYETISSMSYGPSAVTATVADGYYEVSGTAICNSSGTFKVQFAQNSASGSSTVRNGSFISVKQIS